MFVRTLLKRKNFVVGKSLIGTSKTTGYRFAKLYQNNVFYLRPGFAWVMGVATFFIYDAAMGESH